MPVMSYLPYETPSIGSLKVLPKQPNKAQTTRQQLKITMLSRETSSIWGDIRNSTPRASNLSSFHKFLDLPTELRFAIWEDVLRSPQMLRVRAQAASIYLDPLERPTLLLAFTTPSHLYTAISATCRESRGRVLSRFPDRLPAYNGGSIRFNAETDLVFFTNFFHMIASQCMAAAFKTWGYRIPAYFEKLRQVAVPHDGPSTSDGAVYRYKLLGSDYARMFFKGARKALLVDGYREIYSHEKPTPADEESTALLNARMEKLEADQSDGKLSSRFKERELFVDQGHLQYAIYPAARIPSTHQPSNP